MRCRMYDKFGNCWYDNIDNVKNTKALCEYLFEMTQGRINAFVDFMCNQIKFRHENGEEVIFTNVPFTERQHLDVTGLPKFDEEVK